MGMDDWDMSAVNYGPNPPEGPHVMATGGEEGLKLLNPRPKPVRILYAEDKIDVMRAFNTSLPYRLRELGVDPNHVIVTSVMDGQDALLAIKNSPKNTFDMLITDGDMPIVTGPQLLAMPEVKEAIPNRILYSGNPDLEEGVDRRHGHTVILKEGLSSMRKIASIVQAEWAKKNPSLYVPSDMAKSPQDTPTTPSHSRQ